MCDLVHLQGIYIINKSRKRNTYNIMYVHHFLITPFHVFLLLDFASRPFRFDVFFYLWQKMIDINVHPSGQHMTHRHVFTNVHGRLIVVITGRWITPLFH